MKLFWPIRHEQSERGRRSSQESFVEMSVLKTVLVRRMSQELSLSIALGRSLQGRSMRKAK